MSARNLNGTLTTNAWVADVLPGSGSVQGAVAVAVGTARLWARRVRQRSQLRQILDNDNRFFQDIGLPRATVYNETRKWFWQA